MSNLRSVCYLISPPANCKFLYGQDVDIITLLCRDGYQGIVICRQSSTWRALLRSRISQNLEEIFLDLHQKSANCLSQHFFPNESGPNLSPTLLEASLLQKDSIPSPAAFTVPKGVDSLAYDNSPPVAQELDKERRQREEKLKADEMHIFLVRLEIEYENVWYSVMVTPSRNTKEAIFEAVEDFLKPMIAPPDRDLQRDYEISATDQGVAIDVSAVRKDEWAECLRYLAQKTILPQFCVRVNDPTRILQR
jgi:hypothetical protein